MLRLTGFHAIEESLRSRGAASRGAASGGLPSARLLVSGSGPRIKEILALAAALDLDVERSSKTELDRIAPGHRGIVLEADDGAEAEEVDLDTFVLAPPERSLVVALDHIEDPQNLGAILRSADVFAADLVLAPRRRSAPLSKAAVRASAGRPPSLLSPSCPTCPKPCESSRGPATGSMRPTWTARAFPMPTSRSARRSSSATRVPVSPGSSGPSAILPCRSQWPATWIRSTYRPPRPC